MAIPRPFCQDVVVDYLTGVLKMAMPYGSEHGLVVRRTPQNKVISIHDLNIRNLIQKHGLFSPSRWQGHPLYEQYIYDPFLALRGIGPRLQICSETFQSTSSTRFSCRAYDERNTK